MLSTSENSHTHYLCESAWSFGLGFGLYIKEILYCWAHVSIWCKYAPFRVSEWPPFPLPPPTPPQSGHVHMHFGLKLKSLNITRAFILCVCVCVCVCVHVWVCVLVVVSQPKQLYKQVEGYGKWVDYHKVGRYQLPANQLHDINGSKGGVNWRRVLYLTNVQGHERILKHYRVLYMLTCTLCVCVCEREREMG